LQSEKPCEVDVSNALIDTEVSQQACEEGAEMCPGPRRSGGQFDIRKLVSCQKALGGYEMGRHMAAMTFPLINIDSNRAEDLQQKPILLTW
jgi:hypothetical protein